METKNYIVEAGQRDSLSWESHTCLNTTIQELKDYFGERCNIFEIDENDIDYINQQAQEKNDEWKHLPFIKKAVADILSSKKNTNLQIAA